MYTYEILGDPVPWAAPVKGSQGFYDRKSTHKKAILFQILSQKRPLSPLPGAIQLKFVFFMPVPESTSKKRKDFMLQGEIQHLHKPDLTNMVKLMEDCLEKAGIISNDSHVISQINEKKYGEVAKTIIEVNTV